MEEREKLSDEVKNAVSGDRAEDIIRLIRDSDTGNVTTSEVRDATGMGNDETRYQFRKLEKAGIIEIEYREDLTPKGRSPMISVSLTSEGLRAVSEGIVGKSDFSTDEEKIDEKTPQEKLDELKHDFQEFKDENWSEFARWATSVENKLKELESLVESKRDEDE